MVLYSTEISKLVKTKTGETNIVETDTAPKSKKKTVCPLTPRKKAVVTESEEAPKKKRVRVYKPKKAIEEEEEEEEGTVTTLVEPSPKPKKEPTEKQLENLKKGQEKRKAALKEKQKKTISAIEKKISTVKASIKKRTSNPPQWFSKYIENVKKTEAEECPELVSLSDVKAEAKQITQNSWSDASTRTRINDEYNNHQKKMFNMIFSR